MIVITTLLMFIGAINLATSIVLFSLSRRDVYPLRSIILGFANLLAGIYNLTLFIQNL